MMNEYCSFKFLNKQKKKKKNVFNIPTSRMQGTCKLSNNSRNVLYYGTLHRVNFRPIWT